MNRTSIVALGVIALLTVAVLAGCEGEGESSPPGFDPNLLTFTWVKTSRMVNGVAEVPITVPMTYSLESDGSKYTATDGVQPNPYTESGTWDLTVSSLMFKMAANNAGRPVEWYSATIALVDNDHFTLTYDSDIGGGHSIHIVETYTKVVV